MTSVSSKQFLK